VVFEVIDNGRDFIFKDMSPPPEGVNPEDIQGKRITELPGYFHRGVVRILREVDTTGEPKSFTIPYYEGGELRAWAKGTVYKVSRSEIIVTLKHVTEVKKLEEEIEEKEQYKSIFENTNSATAILEEDTIISLCNREFEKLTGYSREEIEGKKSWTEFVVGEDLEKMKRYHKLRRKDPRLAPRRYTLKIEEISHGMNY